MLNDDTLANVLYVDLTQKRFWVERREDLFSQYIGGVGVGIQLLHEECPEGCDALSAQNPIILAVGPLNGLFPVASKTIALFKSPHTDNLGESHAGGRSAVAIRLAGYGAIVIRGASEIPLYLAIDGDQVHFRDASTLWGMRSVITAGRVIRSKEPAAGFRTIMRIGRAGEKLIPYAGVATETYRHFGRLGLGAVFGSKKLKALVVGGKRSLPVSDPKLYQRIYDEIYQAAINTPAMKKYHDLGTPENVLPLNKIGALPTRNLQDTQFEGAPDISGETFAEHHLGRRLACAHCPVACIHLAALREPYGDEDYFYKTSMIAYDYEPLYAMGPMLGISDAKGVLKLLEKVDEVALDAMSTGVILAWATEAQERGLISEKETEGIKLSWGDYASYLKAIPLIVEQTNEFYQALARGVMQAAAVYGGQDFALAFGKNEMPGYHTGPAQHVGALIATRHHHCDNAGYSIDQKVLVKEKLTPRELAQTLLKEERWRQILTSLAICLFAREIYKPELVSRALQVAGFDIAPEDFLRLGAEIHSEKYRFKFREGFSLDDYHLPKRIFETPSAVGKLDEKYIRQTIGQVKKILVKKQGKS